jgi:hypothetical protein
MQVRLGTTVNAPFVGKNYHHDVPKAALPIAGEERLSQVWDLSQEVWLFFQGINAEQRLQRDVAVLIRGKR